MKKILWFFVIMAQQLWSAQWVQKANFQGFNREYGVGFFLSGRCYYGTGKAASQLTNDFWMYDPAFDAWTQCAAFPGTPRYYSTSMIGRDQSGVQAGFLFGGLDTAGVYQNDLWMFQSQQNQWTQKPSLPSYGRIGATGLSEKGDWEIYICCGKKNATATLGDMWRFDCSSDTWTQRTAFPGSPRWQASGVTTNGWWANRTVFMGLDSLGNCLGDSWSYNQVFNQWQLFTPSFPGSSRFSPITFFGYYGPTLSVVIGLGKDSSGAYPKDCWFYNQSDGWVRMNPDFPGAGRIGMSYAGILSAANYFILCGKDSIGGLLNETWQLTFPAEVNSEVVSTFCFSISGNEILMNWDAPYSGSLFIYNLSGQVLRVLEFKDSRQIRYNMDGLSKGVLLFKLVFDDGKEYAGKVLKWQDY